MKTDYVDLEYYKGAIIRTKKLVQDTIGEENASIFSYRPRKDQYIVYQKIIDRFYPERGLEGCYEIAKNLGMIYIKPQCNSISTPRKKSNLELEVLKNPIITTQLGKEAKITEINIDEGTMTLKLLAESGELLFFEYTVAAIRGYIRNGSKMKILSKNCVTLPCSTFLCSKCLKVTPLRMARQKGDRSICKTCYNKQRIEITYSDPQRIMAMRLRTRLSQMVRKAKTGKAASTLDLLGCSLPQFMAHIQSKFKEGMSWDNHPKWHIDHIRPCASFDLTKEEEQKQCFHYTNLQPLWAHENFSKGDKWEG